MAKGHIDHPEDLVLLNGINGAKTALSAIVNAANMPQDLTVKYDGYPAIIFGRDIDGRFSVMDKHMFNKRDGSGRAIFSPTDFVQYDVNRGVDRSSLWNLIESIWESLEAQSSNVTGYMWGDVLFGQHLIEKDGKYRFKANPHGLTYEIDADSVYGGVIPNKIAGIAVHQSISQSAMSVDEASSLHGTIGKLQQDGDVLFIPTALPVDAAVKLDSIEVNRIATLIAKSSEVNELCSEMPAGFTTLLTVFINKCVVDSDFTNMVTRFLEFVAARKLPESSKQNAITCASNNQRGLAQCFDIWKRLYGLKMQLVNQLDAQMVNSPIRAYLDDGKMAQEGYVGENVKFVNRLGFSRQNLAAKI